MKCLSDAKIVGVFCNRNLEAYLSVLSAFYIGKTFVPLNPKFPDHKLSRIIKLSSIDTILHSKNEAERVVQWKIASFNISEFVLNSLLSKYETVFPILPVNPSDIVYHMFTSGSTGDPKGVPISHQNLSAYVTGISSIISFKSFENFSQVFDLSFDLSMHDIFVCFYNQGTLVAASDIDLMMPSRYIDKQKIDHWFSVPVLADLAVKISEKMPVSRKLKTSLFCGEALPMETALQFGRRLVESHEVWNLYGPTEATIAISVRNVTDVKNEISIAPLGKAYGANVLGIQVKNGDIKTEFSEGMEGQLLLGGPQVFGGYSPKVDKDVFVEYGEINFYKSGDLVKFSQNELLYLGRLDHQVKIRGHRVELSEIEVAFRKVSGVKMVAAYTIGEIGDKQIHLAYQSDQNIENFSELKDYLPDYMIPVKYIHFVELPTNENGKIDRNAIKVITQ